MKKIIILAAFAITGLVANAQKGFHAGIKLIPQTVWTISEGLDEGPPEYTSKFRFAGGVSLDYHFSDKAGAGLDLIYSPQGQAFTCETCDGEKFVMKVDYFKLPILLHWNGDPEKVAMFMGEFGPQFSFLTKAESPEIFGSTVDISDDFRKVNVGVVLGLGVGFNITEYLVASVKIRLDAHLTDAAADDSELFVTIDEDPPYESHHQRAWAFTGGLPEIGIKYVLRTK